MREVIPLSWSGSPFAWIQAQDSRRRAQAGRQFAAGWCAAKGLDIVSSGHPPAHRLIAGHRVDIRFSTLRETGTYAFRLSPREDYDYAFCLGISPFDAHGWVISKAVLRKHVLGHTPQHAGKKGTDTFWLSFDPSDPPEWLRACGGKLADAFAILKKWAS